MTEAADAPTDTVRVVVADDAPDVRFLVGMLLESAGADIRVVAEAADGPEAVLAVRRERPDCLVIDLDMPGGGGLAAIERVRASHPDLPVVLLTGFADSEQLHADSAHGADTVLSKGDTIHGPAPTIIELVGSRRVSSVPA